MTYVEIETGMRGGEWGYAVHHWDVKWSSGEIKDMCYFGEFENGCGYASEESAREAAKRRLTADYGGGWTQI